MRANGGPDHPTRFSSDSHVDEDKQGMAHHCGNVRLGSDQRTFATFAECKTLSVVKRYGA